MRMRGIGGGGDGWVLTRRRGLRTTGGGGLAVLALERTFAISERDCEREGELAADRWGVVEVTVGDPVEKEAGGVRGDAGFRLSAVVWETAVRWGEE